MAAGNSLANAIEPGVALTAAREAAKTKAFKETARTAAAFSCGMICMSCVYATLSLIPD